MAESLMFQVGIDTQDYQKGFKKMSNVNKDFNKGLKTLGKTLMGVFAGVGLKNAISATTKAFLAQEKAEKRLKSITKSVTGATNEQIQSMKALASSLQNVGVIGDEVSLSGMSQLATFKLNTESIKQLTPALQTLAVAQYGTNVSQEQIIQTANLLGKSYQGLTGSLSRVGITFNETQAEILKTGNEQERVAILTEVINQNFGDLNKAMRNTASGALQSFNNAWGDLLEVIGGKITPILVNVANLMTDSVIPALTAFVNDPIQGLKQLYDRIGLIGQVVVGITGAFVGLQVAGKAWTLLTNVIKIGSSVIVGVFKTIFSWPAILAGAVYLFSVAWRNDWGGIQEKTQKVWNAISPIITGIWDWLRKAGSVVLEWSFNLFGGAWDWFKDNKGIIGDVLQKTWDSFKNLTSKVVDFSFKLIGIAWDWLLEHGDVFLSVGKKLFDWLGGIVGQVWDVTLKGFDTVAQFFGDLTTYFSTGNLEDLWTAVKNFAVNLVSIMWDNFKVGLETFWNLAKIFGELFAGIFPEATKWGADLLTNIWSGFKNIFNNTFDLIGLMRDWLTDTTSEILQWGADLGNKIWEGIGNALSNLNPLNWFKDDAEVNVNVKYGGAGRDFKDGIVPKFADGTKAILDRSGFISGAGTSRSDSNLAWLSDGEAVINAKSTAKYRPILKAINENKFSLGNIPKFKTGNLKDSDYMGDFLNTLGDDWDFITAQMGKMYDKMNLNIDGYDSQLQSMQDINNAFDSLTIQTEEDTSKAFENLTTQTTKLNDENIKLNEQLKKQEDLQKQYNQTLQDNINNFKLGTTGEDMANEGLSSFFKTIGGTVKTKMSDVFSQGGELIQEGIGFLPALGSGLSTAFSSLLTSIGPVAVVAFALGNIFSGMMEVLQPLITNILNPIINFLKLFGTMLASFLTPNLKLFGAVIQITLIPVMKVWATVMNSIISVFEWAGDQLTLFVNSIAEKFDWVPGVDPFLSNSEKNRLGRSIEDRFKERQDKTKDDFDIKQQKPQTNGGDTYQAGSTQNITYNNYVNIDGQFATSGQIEDLAELVADKISARKDLSGKIVTAGGGA